MSIYYPSDKNGNEIPFRTPVEYIYDDDFTTLASKLSSYNNRITGKETEIGDAIPTSLVFANDSLSMKNADNEVITTINLPSKSTYPPVAVSNVSINKKANSILLHWTDPNNSYADVAQTVPIAVWCGTRVVVKKGSAPAHPNDGVKIVNSTVKNQYTSVNPLVIRGLLLGETYYIRFFPYGEDDTYNADTSMIYNITLTDLNYGFHIDSTDSNCSTAITYLADAVGKTPAHMNYTTGEFDWGDWYDDEFFMPRPCMLKYDGTVDYYLDPDDYTKKEDGTTASDISNTSYGGNAMMEWGRGGKKIWYKVVPDNDPTGVSIYISSKQVDSGYHCWNFYDASNTVRDHFYTPIYNGSYVSERMRSLSGQSLGGSKDVETEISYARSNNTAGSLTGDRWYTETYGDRMLINWLLVLMSKSLDSQTSFGYGNSYSFGTINTGTMNDKGMFWGENTGNYGVKTFGMENYWGNVYRRVAGYVSDASYQYIKLTPNNADGSTATTYTTDATGMINTNVSSSNTNTYTRWYKYDSLGYSVIYQNGQTGSDSTYYPDYGRGGANEYYAVTGGNWIYGMDNGAFAVSLYNFIEATSSYINSSISFR